MDIGTLVQMIQAMSEALKGSQIGTVIEQRKQTGKDDYLAYLGVDGQGLLQGSTGTGSISKQPIRSLS